MFHVEHAAPGIARRPRARLLAAVAAMALLFLAQTLAIAGVASKEFNRLWPEAGANEERKLAILDGLSKERTPDAAKILLAVALMANEPAAITERAVAGLAEQEGAPSDAWIKAEAKKAQRWAERAILARAVSRRTSEEAAALLRDLLTDKAWQVQAAAIEGLRGHRTRASIEALIALWLGLDPKRDETPRLSGDLRDTLILLAGKEFETGADAHSWWTANGAAWKPDAKGKGSIEGQELVTGERTPRLFDEVRSRKALLVLDTSGSMRVETGAGKDPKTAPNGLTRFEVMRREVKRVVEELPPSASFGLLGFGTKVTTWKAQLVLASDGNKKGAGRFLDALKADGETNSYGALEEAFKNAEVDTIYFLSDGYPTAGATIDLNKIIADVKKWNGVRNVRIHTIAFVAGNGKPIGIEEGDKSLPKEFMKRLAQENGGRYKLVE